MSEQHAKIVGQMRDGAYSATGADNSHDTGAVQPTVSAQRGSALRAGKPRLDGVVPTGGRQDEPAGPLSGGRQRASGAGGTDGGAFRDSGGGTIGSGPRFDTAVPPGGYLWWYVDGLSDCGRYGISVISFVGSVFSPYYAWRGRQNPDDHLCINVALYAPSGNRWAMTERGNGSGARTEMTFKVGPSDLTWENGVLTLNFDEMSVPRPPAQWLPKRIKGKITLTTGAITNEAFDIDAKGMHRWWPIAPSSRISLEFDGGTIPDWSGHGYLDSNWGVTGLEEAFTRWDWARGDLPDGRTIIIYDTQRRDGTADCLSLAIDKDGSIEQVEQPMRTELGKGFWGVKRVGHSDAGTVPYIKTVLEDGPFYTRGVVQTTFEGQPLTLMHESLSGDRFASAIVKAMLCFRMPRRA